MKITLLQHNNTLFVLPAIQVCGTRHATERLRVRYWHVSLSWLWFTAALSRLTIRT